MEKLNVAIADDNEKMLDLLGKRRNIRYYQGKRARCSTP